MTDPLTWAFTPVGLGILGFFFCGPINGFLGLLQGIRALVAAGSSDMPMFTRLVSILGILLSGAVFLYRSLQYLAVALGLTFLAFILSQDDLAEGMTGAETREWVEETAEDSAYETEGMETVAPATDATSTGEEVAWGEEADNADDEDGADDGWNWGEEPKTPSQPAVEITGQVGPLGFADPDALRATDRRLYFTAKDRQHGEELWSLEAGRDSAQRLGEIVSGPAAADIGSLTAVAGHAVFAARTPQQGAEAWISDGTPQGTRLLFESAPGSDSGNPSGFTFALERLYCAADSEAGREVWVAEGRPGAAQMLTDINPGEAGSEPAEFTQVGQRLYFAATDASHGRELWATDGTAEGTQLVRDIREGVEGSGPSNLAALGSMLFFAADYGSGRRFWISNGTADGTVVWQGAGGREPREFTAAGGLMYFLAQDDAGNHELWRSDGTGGGTQVLARYSAAARVGDLTAVGEALCFTLITENGAAVIRCTGTRESMASLCTQPAGRLCPVGDDLYFVAQDNEHGIELWVYDARRGARMVQDIRPGIDGSNPDQLTACGDRLYFLADDGSTGLQLWTSDGSPYGTRAVGARPSVPEFEEPFM